MIPGVSLCLCRRGFGTVGRRFGLRRLGLFGEVFAHPDQPTPDGADGFESGVRNGVDYRRRRVQHSWGIDVRPLLDLVSTGLGEAIEFVAKLCAVLGEFSNCKDSEPFDGIWLREIIKKFLCLAVQRAVLRQLMTN